MRVIPNIHRPLAAWPARDARLLAACLAAGLMCGLAAAREPWPEPFATAPTLPFEPLPLPNPEPLMPPAQKYTIPGPPYTVQPPTPVQAQTPMPAPAQAARPSLASAPALAQSSLPSPAESGDATVLMPTQDGTLAAACGPLEFGCPDYRLYAIADFLFMGRYSGLADRPLAFNEDSGNELLSTQDLQWAFVPGFRGFFGERRPAGWGWEVGYLGLYGMNASSQVFGPGNLIAPGDLGASASQFNSADLMNVTYKANLNMAEANVFCYSCCGKNACQTACQDGCKTEPSCGSCRCIDWLVGFRWAGLGESANFASTCCGLTEKSDYGVDASSNLFGGQVGVRGRRDYAHWACEGWMKIGLAGVWMSQTQSPIIDYETGIPFREGSSSSATGLAGFADANASAIYKINRNWGFRAGLNAIWLGNVALAPDQWDFSQTASATTINTGSLFLLGANVGLEAHW